MSIALIRALAIAGGVLTAGGVGFALGRYSKEDGSHTVRVKKAIDEAGEVLGEFGRTVEETINESVAAGAAAVSETAEDIWDHAETTVEDIQKEKEESESNETPPVKTKEGVDILPQRTGYYDGNGKVIPNEKS